MSIRFNPITGQLDIAGGGGSSVDDAIVNGVTTRAPSQNAVFDGLALKADLAGATFTGTVNINTLLNIATTSSSTVGVIRQNGVRLLHTYGSENVFLGAPIANFTSTGSGQNVGIGTNNFLDLTSGYQNTGIGYQTMRRITDGYRNVGIGAYAGHRINTGSNNLCIGMEAGAFITSGEHNVMIGQSAGYGVGTGIGNVFIGASAGSTSNRNYETMIGYLAGYQTGSKGEAVMIGARAGEASTTAENCTYIGMYSGYLNVTGDNQTMIGNRSTATVNNLINAHAYGYKAFVSTSNSMVLGGNDVDGNAVNVGINVTDPTEARLVIKGNIFLRNQGELRLNETTANGTDYVSIRAPSSVTSTYTLTLPAAVGTVDQIAKTDASGNLSWMDNIGVVGVVIDGSGSAIAAGTTSYITVPYSGTITEWTLIADQSGSIVIDVWKDTYANFPPTVADTIAGSEKPTLSSANKNQDTNLTTWTTAVSAGDVIAFSVDSASTVTRVTLTLKIRKS
jgi:hypothetical protein